MTDNATPQASPIPTTPDPVPAPRKKRWLRRIVIGLSVVVVLLIGLVVLLPTIVSLSPVRSMVMSQVSGYLDGRAEVESWSIGWFSPLSVQGLRVYDNDNAMVLDISKLQTEATLGSLVRGNLDLGKTRAAIDATKVIIYPDGTTNLHRIARLTDAEPKPRKEETESSIPDVKVDLTLQLTAGVQLLDASGKPVTMLQVRPGSGGTIKIADINKGIDTDLKLVYIVDAGTTSTVSIIGSADAIEGNQIAIDQLTAKLRILLQDIDTAAARPVLVMAGVQGVEVGGLVNGQIDADLQPGQAGSIKGTPTVTNVVFAHSTIADRYQAREVSFPIDVSRVIENGVTRLKIDIRAIAPELSAAITGDIAESSIAQLQARQLPGADGQIAVELTADPAKAAKSLPNTFKLLPGVTVAGGTVHAKSDVWLKPSSIVYGVSTNLSASGTHDGKPISIEPVTLTTRGTVVDLANPVQGLRDLSLDLASRFATFNATGTSATTLSGKGSADLGLLRQQLAQFSDLSNTQLAGKAAITLANTPKTGTADAYALNLTLTLNDIKATLPDTPLIDLPFVKVGVESGYVLGTDSGNPIQQIDTTTATVLAGTSAEKPLADVLIVLSNIDPKARTGSFDLQRATITSLPELQKMIDPFVPQLLQQQIELTGGAVYVVTKGSADLLAGRITLDSFDFSAPSLRINRAGKLFIDEKRIALSTAGQLSAGEQIVIDLSRFSLESAIATLTTNAKPLSITLGAEGLPRGNGTINATIRLPQLNRIAQSLSTEPINTVSSGQLTGDLSFANTDGKPTVGFNGKVNALSIDSTPIQNESVTIALNGVTTDAIDRANASANIKGSFVSLSLKNGSVLLKRDTPVLKMIESALVELGVPDAAKAVTVAQALVPGLKLPYTPSGGIALTADVKPGQVGVDLKASRLTLTNPLTGRTYRFDPKKLISLQTTLDIDGEESIRSIRVSKLTGDLDLVQLSMPEPIVIDDPLGTPVPRGNVRLVGTIQHVTPLLQFLQNTPALLPYQGAFDLAADISVQDQVIMPKLTGAISDFVLLDQATGKPVFSEKQVDIKGDFAIDQAQQLATIRSLDIDMASSKAATVRVSGAVKAYGSDAPTLDKVVIKIDAVGEKAWAILFPLLPIEQQANLKTATLAGPVVFEMTANGSYITKTGTPMHEAIKPLNVRGQLAVTALNLTDAYGLDVKKLTQFFTLEKGLLVTGHRDAQGKFAFAPPFDVNGGKGDLGSVVINIGHPDMLVSIGRKQKLLTGVQLNPVMAAQLGSLASVMFKDSKTASGLVDVMVVDCTNVPLADLMAGSKKAKAEILYSIKNLRIDGPVPSALSGLLNWGDQGIVGSIDNGSLVLADGIAHQNMTFSLVKMGSQRDPKTGKNVPVELIEQLMFKGGINLEKQKFQDYSLWMSQGLLLADWRKSFPKGATVQLKGDVSDIGSILTQTVGSLAVQGFGGSLIDDLLNKKK